MKNKIVRFIQSQISRSRSKGVVLGLSGGIDSALTAVLCKHALGREKVLCLLLPCDSHKQDLDDARLIIKKFRLRAQAVDIRPIYKASLKILPKAGRIASANLKARLRMAVIYYFANKYNYLVCGTSNNSERMAGYFTKHGDGGADFLPLGDLSKARVRKLAGLLNIPARIIAKAPSAGLWPGQTDEAELGMSYSDLDDILLRLRKGQKQVRASRLVNKVKSCIKSSEHKRRPAPVCMING
jgi:NAD+ synthase